MSVLRILLGVQGMDTPGAARQVQETLTALEGVIMVEAGVDNQAVVEYDSREITVMDLIRSLRRLGFLAGME